LARATTEGFHGFFPLRLNHLLQMAIARIPQLGSKPVELTVKLKAYRNSNDSTLTEGLQELYSRGEFADVEVACAEQRFKAHRAVLASQSSIFKAFLSSTPPPNEIRPSDVSNPEAVKIMLDYMYAKEEKVWGDLNPRTQEINKDVLRLARTFDLPGLTAKAMHWLGKDLTTGNVVERLAICDEFQLEELKIKILEQLTYNKAALSEVANSPQIMEYPKLMQAILQCAAGDPSEQSPQQPKGKRARKSA